MRQPPGHNARPLNPPVYEDFDQYSQDYQEAHAEEMPMQPTGRTSQHQVSPPPARQPNPHIEKASRAPLQSRAVGILANRKIPAISAIYEFATTGLIAGLVFSVAHLGQEAASPQVSRILALIVNVKIVIPIFLISFLTITRNRLPGWVRSVAGGIQELASEASLFIKLIAWILAYFFIDFLL